jgi:hypothetical protein
VTDYSTAITVGSSLQYYLIPTRYENDGTRVYLNPNPLTIPPSIVISANFGTITYTSIEIQNITGTYTSIGITRTNTVTGMVDASYSLTIDASNTTTVYQYVGRSVVSYTSYLSFIDKKGLTYYDPSTNSVQYQYVYSLIPYYYCPYNNTTLTGIPFTMLPISVMPPLLPVFN